MGVPPEAGSGKTDRPGTGPRQPDPAENGWPGTDRPDGGLQPERTRLAWRRTALAVTVVTVLAVRLALPGGPVGVVLAALALVGWVAVLLVAHPRLIASRWRRSAAAIPLSALAAAGYAALGIVLVIRTGN